MDIDINIILGAASNVLVGIGLIFMLFGVIGLFRFKDFYPRILMAAKIDTVGMFTLLLGLSLRFGFSFFTAKLVLLMIIILVLNPLVAHVMARSAYVSGYKLKGQLVTEPGEDREETDWAQKLEMEGDK